MSDLLDLPLTTLDGEPTTLGALTGGRAALVVNVASRCGLTPQYAGWRRCSEEYADRGFTVVGVPCNQFAGQEPGTAEEIGTFCSATYGVTFPMTEKLEVNGDDAAPLYRRLTEVPDAAGEAGAVAWNFEKFLLDRRGRGRRAGSGRAPSPTPPRSGPRSRRSCPPDGAVGAGRRLR